VLSQDDGNRKHEADEEKERVRKVALEFMITPKRGEAFHGDEVRWEYAYVENREERMY
jgi:hypothetical protein